jgi:mycofactocin precursor
MDPQDPAATADAPAEESDARQEVLVEEVSIDGMCGVY